MGYLYQNQCYPSGQQVADLMSSAGFQAGGVFAQAAFTGTGYAGSWLHAVNGAVQSVLIEVPAVACDPPGPVGSGTKPMTLDETVQVSWMIVAVWITVWSIKSLKRAL